MFHVKHSMNELTFETKIALFREHLLEVNRHISLISRQNSNEIADDLIADSVAILSLIKYTQNACLLDIGSGAGFPWIIHKIARPDLQIVSVDSNRRKIEFQRDMARRLGFVNCRFCADRIENLPPIGADYCVAKALGTVELICRLAGQHLKKSGRLILPRSANQSLDVISVQVLGFDILSETEYQAVERKAKLLILSKK